MHSKTYFFDRKHRYDAAINCIACFCCLRPKRKRIRKKEAFLSELQFPFVQKWTAKKTSKLDNQTYLSPQNTLELPANQPESFPGGT